MLKTIVAYNIALNYLPRYNKHVPDSKSYMNENAPNDHERFLARVHHGYDNANHVARAITKGTLGVAKEVAFGVLGLNPPATVSIVDAVDTENGGIDFIRVPTGEAFREATGRKTPQVSEGATVFIDPALQRDNTPGGHTSNHEPSPAPRAAP